MRLQGRMAVVTGAASGIGRAIAERFAVEGAGVVVADRNIAGAQEVADGITVRGGVAIAVDVDVTDAEAVARMVETGLATLGHVDVLVNNAGASRGDDLLHMDEADWEFNLAVVLRSAVLCSKALLPQMLARKHGSIVNIASVNGLLGLGEEGYGAAKAGMINLTKNMAVKYGPSGVRANVICPGTIRTPIWQPQLDHDPDVLERLVPWYPLGRVGEPEDVANATLFLASDEAAWITGATLVVDGGLTAGIYRMGQDLRAGVE